MNKYEVKIVKSLLKKYYKRKSIYKDAPINRRIDLPISKILKDYTSFNVNLDEKELVNQAIKSLKEKTYITASSLKLSDDFEKLYLNLDKVALLEEYALKELDITPRTFVKDAIKEIINNYKNKGKIIDYYINEIENIISNSYAQLDAKKEEDILKILLFLEHNHKFLYIREASMLIFGDSKYLENNRKNQVSSILLKYFESIGEEVYDDENLFERFNIYDTDQNICIKGLVSICINGKIIDIDELNGGVSFSIKDIEQIEKITVNCENIITIENKTSFLRMPNDACYIYLGGFATKPQITFIKKLINDNPHKEYLHFGDIDAGGFWIHKKLCEQTGIFFKLFHMNKQDLKDPKYRNCLKSLSDIDIKRLSTLKNDKCYKECIDYMLYNNVKLEQEIISLYLAIQV